MSSFETSSLQLRFIKGDMTIALATTNSLFGKLLLTRIELCKGGQDEPQ